MLGRVVDYVKVSLERRSGCITIRPSYTYRGKSDSLIVRLKACLDPAHTDGGRRNSIWPVVIPQNTKGEQ